MLQIKKIALIVLALLLWHSSAYATGFTAEQAADCPAGVSAVTISRCRYVDPQIAYPTGQGGSGTALSPWYATTANGANATLQLDNDLATGNVMLIFPAQTPANTNIPVISPFAIAIARTDLSGHNLLVDGISYYDTNPSTTNSAWSAYTGTLAYGHTVQATNPFNTPVGCPQSPAGALANDCYARRDDITVRGFHFIATNGQIMFLRGVTNFEFDHNWLQAKIGSTGGPGLNIGQTGPGQVFPWATWVKGCNSSTNCGSFSHDVEWHDNQIDSSFGECQYIAGHVQWEDIPGIDGQTQYNLWDHDNTKFDCGAQGGQGDGTDTKEGIVNLKIEHDSIGHTRDFQNIWFTEYNGPSFCPSGCAGYVTQGGVAIYNKTTPACDVSGMSVDITANATGTLATILTLSNSNVPPCVTVITDVAPGDILVVCPKTGTAITGCPALGSPNTNGNGTASFVVRHPDPSTRGIVTEAAAKIDRNLCYHWSNPCPTTAAAYFNNNTARDNSEIYDNITIIDQLPVYTTNPLKTTTFQAIPAPPAPPVPVGQLAALASSFTVTNAVGAFNIGMIKNNLTVVSGIGGWVPGDYPILAVPDSGHMTVGSLIGCSSGPCTPAIGASGTVGIGTTPFPQLVFQAGAGGIGITGPNAGAIQMASGSTGTGQFAAAGTGYTSIPQWWDLSTSAANSVTVHSTAGGFTSGMISHSFVVPSTLQINNGSAVSNFVAGTYTVATFVDANDITLTVSPTPSAAGSFGVAILDPITVACPSSGGTATFPIGLTAWNGTIVNVTPANTGLAACDPNSTVAVPGGNGDAYMIMGTNNPKGTITCCSYAHPPFVITGTGVGCVGNAGLPTTAPTFGSLTPVNGGSGAGMRVTTATISGLPSPWNYSLIQDPGVITRIFILVYDNGTNHYVPSDALSIDCITGGGTENATFNLNAETNTHLWNNTVVSTVAGALPLATTGQVTGLDIENNMFLQLNPGAGFIAQLNSPNTSLNITNNYWYKPVASSAAIIQNQNGCGVAGGCGGNPTVVNYTAAAISGLDIHAKTIVDAATPLLQNPYLAWLPSTAYASTNLLLDPNGHIQAIQTPGTSGAIIPGVTTAGFSTTGGTTADGSVVWLDTGALTTYNPVNFTPCTTAVIPGTNCSGTASQAYQAGIDLSASFTTDYFGNVRSSPWTMGAIDPTGGAPPASTATTVIVNSTPAVYGATQTFTATVLTGGSTPVTTGSVTFNDLTTGLSYPGSVLSGSGQSFVSGSLGVMSHVIQAAYTPSASFTASSGNVTAVVTPAALTVTATNVNIAFGSLPTYGQTYSGFQNGDTAAVVSGSPAFSNNATTTGGKPNIGTWVITPTIGSLNAANYTFSTFNTGVLKVTSTAVPGSPFFKPEF